MIKNSYEMKVVVSGREISMIREILRNRNYYLIECYEPTTDTHPNYIFSVFKKDFFRVLFEGDLQKVTRRAIDISCGLMLQGAVKRIVGFVGAERWQMSNTKLLTPLRMSLLFS